MFDRIFDQLHAVVALGVVDPTWRLKPKGERIYNYLLKRKARARKAN